MENEKKRIRYFDVARGIGILLVIIGHFGIGTINKFIYSFHMPLFFCSAGYFTKIDNNRGHYINKRGRQLLVPYYFTCLCVIVGAVLIDLMKGNDGLSLVLDVKMWVLSGLYASGNIEVFGIKRIGAIWFLWALFISQIIFQECVRHRYYYIIAMVFFLIGIVSGNSIWLPLSIQPAFTCVVFLLLGYIAKQKNTFENISWKTIALFLGIWVLGIFVCNTNVAKNYYSHSVLNIIVATCGSYIVICASKGFTDVKKFKTLAQILEYLGNNSLIIMCFHLIELNLINWNRIYSFFLDNGMNRVSTYLICFLIKFVYLLATVYMVHHVKLLAMVFSTHYSRIK